MSTSSQQKNKTLEKSTMNPTWHYTFIYRINLGKNDESDRDEMKNEQKLLLFSFAF